MKKSPFRKLVEFAKVNDTKIKVFTDCMTSFIPSVNTIFINRSDYKGTEFLAAISHELGHSIQSGEINEYKNINEDKYPKRFTKARFANEVDAWKNSMSILDSLNINVDIVEFDNIVKTSLETYYKLYA